MKTKSGQPNAEPRRIGWRPLFLGFVAICLGALWTGCQQDAKDAAGANPVGTYTLVTVNGKQLPCTVTEGGQTGPTVKSGTFVINGDGTCSSKTTFAVGSSPDSTREVKATYTREGSKLTMKWEGAGITTGTVEGNTFTMNNEGTLLAYRK